MVREFALRASTHGAQPSPFAARIGEYSRGDRARRALRRFLPIFGAGCALLLVPPHVFWLLGFSLTGAVLALQRYRQEREILELGGSCPECKLEQKLAPPAALPAILRCPGCGAFLKLEAEP